MAETNLATNPAALGSILEICAAAVHGGAWLRGISYFLH
jgi:hypothetical protein